MKTKSIIATIFLALILPSCAPASSPLPPTVASVPTAISTPVLPPTITPTPVHENIADAKDLFVWVDEYVHAFGGTVTINGVDMDASRLTDEIRINGDKYFELKKVNGMNILFLNVNGSPLAFREENGQWQEATMAKLSEMTSVVFEFSPRIPDEHTQQYIDVLKKVAGKNTRFTFPSEMDTCRIYNDFSLEQWKSIISNWENIEADLNNGIIPDGYPYHWQGVNNIMDFTKANVDSPQFRGQHLVEIRLSYCMLADSIINLREKENFTHDEMLKILEFVVRTRVIKFPEVANWDVEDEMIAADVVAQTGGGNYYRFWLDATNKSAVELVSTVADWVKHDRPSATTYIVESAVFDNRNPDAKWEINAFDKFIEGLSKNQAKVDKIIVENNLWIFSPPDMDYISQKIDMFKSLGFAIGGSETMIVTGDEAINGNGRLKQIQVSDRNEAQANLYRNLLSLYLSKGINTFGFGGIEDYNAWTNDVNLPDANPLLFDDNFRAKQSYYAIIKALYEYLFSK